MQNRILQYVIPLTNGGHLEWSKSLRKCKDIWLRYAFLARDLIAEILILALLLSLSCFLWKLSQMERKVIQEFEVKHLVENGKL